MNYTILKKCLTELDKESPRLDYIRGMLEVLLVTEKPIIVPSVVVKSVPMAEGVQPFNQASILDAKARAAIESVKAMSGTTIE